MNSYSLGQQSSARKPSALFAVDAEKGVFTHGGREGQAALTPEINYLATVSRPGY